ncbi:hypothetical protein Verru16b_03181 [Lacunisphaera limnophila]|uniref:Uncharacterized protein n=1 Tax=Lacunisphaera limnophila TaxID=1838286 RepID=A0A1D8AYX0_9BACT|nr:hypothetical protein [Lacunisphaera limnophila]AOS46086.1 hypothetical protein Verru16b_03181 [Lacunisphaera limnophila]
MKNKYIKRRGHIYAVVRKPESVEHLSPTSVLHEVHKEYALQLKQHSNGLIGTDITPPGKLKFSSLGGGLVFNGTGAAIRGPEFEDILNRCRHERGYYLAPESARGGGYYYRPRDVDPVRQLALTVFPAHAHALIALESAGKTSARVINGLISDLRAVFVQETPYEPLAFSVHPEESMLHIHLCYSVVDERHNLLHEGNQLGQPAKNFLGMGRIGTLRLVEFGLWPESDAVDIRDTIRRKLRQFGSVPIDWRLHETLDGHLEAYFRASRDPKVTLAYEVALEAYRKHVQVVRATRPDVLIEANANLRDQLDRANARLKAPQGLQVVESPAQAIKLLDDITDLIMQLSARKVPPAHLLYAADHVVPVVTGGWRVSPQLVRIADAFCANPQYAQHATDLAEALSEANTTAEVTSQAFRERNLQLDQISSICEKLEEAEARIDVLEGELRDLTPTEAIQLLQGIVQMLPLLFHRKEVPEKLGFATEYVVPDRTGGWRIAPALMLMVSRIISDPDNANMVEELRHALSEAVSTAQATSRAKEQKRDRNDQQPRR